MPITYKLEHPDGTPADPPTFQSAAGTSWNIGDVLYLGREDASRDRHAPARATMSRC